MSKLRRKPLLSSSTDDVSIEAFAVGQPEKTRGKPVPTSVAVIRPATVGLGMPVDFGQLAIAERRVRSRLTVRSTVEAARQRAGPRRRRPSLSLTVSAAERDRVRGFMVNCGTIFQITSAGTDSGARGFCTPRCAAVSALSQISSCYSLYRNYFPRRAAAVLDFGLT